MGFDKLLAPTPRRVANKEGISASVVTHNGALRLQLYFTKAMAMSVEDKCNVHLGDGSDVGSLMLDFRADGAFGIVRRANGQTTLKMLVPECVPSGYELRSEPCHWSWLDKTHLVVRLPIAEWKNHVESI
jgi:hypothetical protein